MVIDADRFMPAAELAVDTLVRDVHATAPADGVDHVYVPGEIEHLTRERRLGEGIPLSVGVLETLDTIATDVEVAPLLDESRLAKDCA